MGWQPALTLTAPNVAGAQGDGLLTMNKILTAGTRAVLVTSVHSQSVRDLVSDLFARQQADASLSRSEALHRAMMALLDGKGFTDDSGQTLFTYGHPLFWAAVHHHRRRPLILPRRVISITPLLQPLAIADLVPMPHSAGTRAPISDAHFHLGRTWITFRSLHRGSLRAYDVMEQTSRARYFC